MNIADQMIVLSVFRQVEDDLHLCVQIENKLTHNLCHLISVYAEDANEKNLCYEYLHSQRPCKSLNSEFMYGRYNINTSYWWPRRDINVLTVKEDYITECHKQRLEFIRHLIGKVEQMSISQTI
jgi:hypothetical protein